MTLPSRKFTLLCVAIYGLVVPTVVVSQQYCNETINTVLCQYDVFCQDYLRLMEDYNFYADLYNRLEYQLHDCRSIRYIPLHLVYKQPRVIVNYRQHINQEQGIPFSDRDDFYRWIYSLDLSNNLYEKSPTIHAMPRLTTLDLSKNLLKTAKLTNKWSLPTLENIDLSLNQITNLEINHDEYILNSLKQINLAYNDLKKFPETFEFFNNLTNLDVSHNSISSLSPNTFEGIKNLVYLNMSYNLISDINSSLFRFKELRSLDLSNNLLYNISNRDFNELIALTNLNLEANFITCIDENTFLNLYSLNVLNMNDNKLEKINKDAFKSANDLKVILISRNKLNTIPKSLLKGKNIESFSIKENSLNGSLERGMFDGLNVCAIQ